MRKVRVGYVVTMTLSGLLVCCLLLDAWMTWICDSCVRPPGFRHTFFAMSLFFAAFIVSVLGIVVAGVGILRLSGTLLGHSMAVVDKLGWIDAYLPLRKHQRKTYWHVTKDELAARNSTLKSATTAIILGVGMLVPVVVLRWLLWS